MPPRGQQCLKRPPATLEEISIAVRLIEEIEQRDARRTLNGARSGERDRRKVHLGSAQRRE
jgi:hypothetical protein